MAALLDIIQTEPDVRRLGQIMMRAWFDSIRSAEAEGRPVAYVFVMRFMADLLRCFDFELVYPEISSLQSAVRKQAPRFFRTAESAGYPVDICNYVKADVGMWLEGGAHPMGQMPRPDLLVSNHLCGVYIKWAEIYERMFDCRSVVFDVPYYRSTATAGVPTSPERSRDRDWVAAQIGELIGACEEISGRAFDEDRLAEVQGYRNEMADVYVEILAFEIDGFDPVMRTGWSVLVQGYATEITRHLDPRSEALRRLPVDPFGSGPKAHWIEIRVVTITGRRIGKSE